ncbi:DUF3465 domain-containing protein [bacterium]|nr:DUF3465 domain-containing protein [bacterium]
MSKRPPELTWQDKAILIVIPFVVFIIFLIGNYISKDLTVAEAFSQKLSKKVIRDMGNIVEIIPPSGNASNTQLCRVRSREADVEFTFRYNIQGSDTMRLEIGRLLQFYGEYNYDPKGGIIEVPYKGKSGRLTGWAVYENKRYTTMEEAQDHL